jgi:hypothetical protein
MTFDEDGMRVEFPWPTGTIWQEVNVHLPVAEPFTRPRITPLHHASPMGTLSIRFEPPQGTNK